MKRTSREWDQWMLGLAGYAATGSKDPSTKVGAVTVSSLDQRKLSLGYNGFPPGIADDGRLEDRAMKYQITRHAEENALSNATFDTRGGTLYCTVHPCVRCTREILMKGIRRVVTRPLPPIVPGRWTEEIPLAQLLLAEAGVEVVVIGEDCGGADKANSEDRKEDGAEARAGDPRGGGPREVLDSKPQEERAVAEGEAGSPGEQLPGYRS
jgi:dCMP deaminase